ncbi:MAG: hypothetical protein ACPGKO_04695 [Pseudohongiellaceae bacterium]
MRLGLTLIFSLLGLIQYVFSAENSRGELYLVRQALADAALEKGVSVVSSAYVDEDGELVESSFYRSGATLRGVRMTQYFEGDPYDAQVLFSDTAFNVNQSCQDLAPHKYRKAVSIDTSGLLVGNGFDLEFFNTLDEFRSEIEMSATSAIAGNPDYYVLPVNNRTIQENHRYYAELSPRSNSIDNRNSNYVMRAEIIDLSAVRYSTKKFYKRGITGSKNLQKFVKNGFKRPLIPYENREEISKSSFDFELVISIVQNDVLGSARRVIAQNSLKVRYDEDNDSMSLREPLIDDLRRLIPSITEENLSSNETVASARDLSVISQIFKSILEQAANQINCEVEVLKTYDSEASFDDGMRLNQGLLSGVNIGDRFILSESDFTTGMNPISSTQLENLAIAEVSEISEYSSMLRVIEGSQQDLYSLNAVPF